MYRHQPIQDAPGPGMKAARYYGKEDIRIEHDVPRPVCGEGQVKVAPAFVGICGTDLHEYMGGPNFSPTTPHPVTKSTLPITIGHEFSGTVLALGPNVTHLSLHQRIAIQPNIFCSDCAACTSGTENACPNGGFVGLSGSGGGMAEEVVLPAQACLPLPENVALDVAALIEPLAVAWHAVDASPVAERVAAGSVAAAKCVVFGGGPIGLAVVQCLRARGVGWVGVVETAAKRQQFAVDFGADCVLDPTSVDVPSSARELCGAELGGADVVFDCAGVAASLEAACKSIRARGTVVNVAIWERAVGFNPNWLVFREARLLATLGYRRGDYEGVIAALGEGRLRPEGMITGRIRMEELVVEGYERLIHEKDRHVKILIDVRAGMDG